MPSAELASAGDWQHAAKAFGSGPWAFWPVWWQFCSLPDCQCRQSNRVPCDEFWDGEHPARRCACCGWLPEDHDTALIGGAR